MVHYIIHYVLIYEFFDFSLRSGRGLNKTQTGKGGKGTLLILKGAVQ